MNVPITSDLYGYTAFWRNWLTVLIALGAFGWLVIVGLLVLIWRK